MGEMQDYSGPLKTDLKWEDFSKEFLINLMRSWQWGYMQEAEVYSDVVAEMLSNEEAFEIHREVWKELAPRIGKRIPEMFDIQLDTISDAIKCLQLYMDSVCSPMYDIEWTVKSDTLAVFNTIKCLTLDYYEREAPHFVKQVCHGLEEELLPRYSVDPRARVTPRVHPPLPPEKRVPGEPFCQFDFWLDV